MDRAAGLSVRFKLTLSYAGFLMLAGGLMLAAAWLAGQPRQSFEFLLRYVPDGAISTIGGLVPGNNSFLLRAFAPAAAIALAFLLVFGLLGGWLLAGRMLAPLTRITDATRVAANGSLSHRIRLPGRRDEFRELADAFDTMLTRLEAHVAEQQRFAANASHELRTPLAITQTLLDVARNDPNRDTGELVGRLHVVNARAIDLTEALLLLSRADQRSFILEPVDLSLIAEEATETLLPLAETRGVTIETSGDMTPTNGSHALLLQLTTNLVHNAIVHNLPEQGTVWVATSVHPKRVVLTVENTGHKLTPQLVSTLVEPFQRGTERIRTDHAGVGLGLAIVKSITHAHDGTLTLTPRAAGGLRVTVQLPAAPPPTSPPAPQTVSDERPRRRCSTTDTRSSSTLATATGSRPTATPGIDWSGRRTTGSYPDSKLFVTTLTVAVARRWAEVFSNAVDPGWVPTKMGGPGAPDNLRLGHLTQEWLATSEDPEARTSGGYWYHQRRTEPHPAVRDWRFQDQLLEDLAGFTATRLI